MKKIVHVTMSNSFGGAEKVIFSIIEKTKSKFDFEYVSPKGNIDKYLKKLKVRHYDSSDIKNIKKADIVHSHDFKASVLSAIYKKRNQKLISHLHTSHKWINKISIKSLVFLIASLRMDKVIFVSKSMAEESYIYKKVKKKSEIIINPVDTKKVEALSIGNNKDYDIAFLGRLSDYKDPLRFINIVKSLNGVKAVIIGDGELKDKCIEEIERLNLKDRIQLIGFVENPFPIIKNIKILVAPSKVEALGLAALESMSLGKPVVGSNICGLKDVIKSDTGILCETDDDFRDGIITLLSDLKKYKKFSESAKVFVRENFDIDEYMGKIEKLYS